MDTPEFIKLHFSCEIESKNLSDRSTLSEFFSAFNYRSELLSSYNRFLDESERWSDGTKLVFLEEAQCGCYWAIERSALNCADAIVYSADNTEENLVWEQSDPSFKDFLKTMLFWQAVNGGWPFAGNWKGSKKLARSPAFGLTRIETSPNDSGLRLYYLNETSIVVVDESGEIFAAGRKPADWKKILLLYPNLRLYA